MGLLKVTQSVEIVIPHCISSLECTLSPLKFFQDLKDAKHRQRALEPCDVFYLLLCVVVTIWCDLQLPNFKGQACASIGKSSRCMGHSAWMVNLGESEGEDAVRTYFTNQTAVSLRRPLGKHHEKCEKTHSV